MKKKIKKIPKYAEGAFYANPDFYTQGGTMLAQAIDNAEQSKKGVTAGGVAKGALTGAASGAAMGSMVAPGIGTAIGAIGGALIGGISSGWGSGHGYDKYSKSIRFSDIYKQGSGLSSLWGHSDEWARQQAAMVQSSNIAERKTGEIQMGYKNNPNVEIQPTVLAAEGDVIRQPVTALVSKGELIYDPVTKKLSKIPGSKGKPNTDDDVLVQLQDKQMIVPNSEHSKRLTTNDKTLAYNLEPMIDKPNKKMSKGTIEARDRIIKKVVRLNESTKNKPQQYAKFSDGVDLSLYEDDKQKVILKTVDEWEKDKLQTHLGATSNVNTIKPISARESLSKSFNEMIASNDNNHKALSSPLKTHPGATFGKKPETDINWQKFSDAGYKIASMLEPLVSRAKAEQEYAEYSKFIGLPTYYDINPMLQDAYDTYAISRYNQANLNTSTGAGMHYAAQKATDYAKQIANIRSHQINKQNELIGRNIDAYNKWESDRAQIANSIREKNAANRAAANKINQQKSNQILNQWGQMNLDNNKLLRDEILAKIISPLGEYGTQNWSEIVELLKKNGITV